MTDLSTIQTVWAIAATLLVLTTACAWTAFVMDRRSSRRENDLHVEIENLWSDNDDLWARLEALEEIVHRDVILAENEAEVLQAVVERVRSLEDANRPLTPERILALPSPPALHLVDDEPEAVAPLALGLGPIPALTIPTGYVPIVRSSITDSMYTRLTVDELKQMLDADADPGETVTGELVEACHDGCDTWIAGVR